MYTFNTLFDPLSSLSYIDCRGSANLEMKQVFWRIWFWFPGPCYIVGCSARDMMPFGGRDWEDRVFRWAVRDRTWMRLSAQRMLCIHIYRSWSMISIWLIMTSVNQRDKNQLLPVSDTGPKASNTCTQLSFWYALWDTHTVYIQMNHEYIDIKHNVYTNMNK